VRAKKVSAEQRTLPLPGVEPPVLERRYDASRALTHYVRAGEWSAAVCGAALEPDAGAPPGGVNWTCQSCRAAAANLRAVVRT